MGRIFYGFTAFFEPLVKEFGWSYAQISFASSLRGLEMGIFGPFIGVLVDRLGSRILAFSGVIAVGFGLILLSMTHSLATFYISFLLLCFGAGGVASLVFMTVVANWFHKKIGIDPSDPIQASLGPGIIFEIVLYHFQNRHAAEHFPQLRKRIAGFDDEFYDRYSESLANLYLCGIKGLVTKNQPKRRKQK